MRGHHSFDMRGLRFGLGFLALLVVLFAGVRYGTAAAAGRMITTAQDAVEDATAKLDALRIARANRPPEEAEVLEKLHKYEGTLSTRVIGTASVDTLAQAHERMIAADLGAMKLYLFENGHATATYPILSKGKRGTRWETPTGLYKIETKEENHFSTIGKVDMPFSMQFFGNFFVHGWPTYPDGTPVPEGYSGGCIRLSTEDARRVYDFAASGTPIFVWESPEGTSTPIRIDDAALPKVSAKSFIVADIRSGAVYAEKDADIPYPIASVSKLLTALVANETIHFDRTLTVSGDDRAQTEGSPGSIATGDTFTVGELFYPLLMESNNSAAYTLARYNGQDNFVRWMNDKAAAIGMDHTHMDDPSGLSPQNVSTANDLFKLMRYIFESQSFILNLSREPEKTMEAENGRTYSFRNLNVFTGDPRFLGGKIGYTPEARETMTTVWEIPVDGATTTVSIVVLGSEDRKSDVQKLLAWFAKTAAVSAR